VKHRPPLLEILHAAQRDPRGQRGECDRGVPHLACFHPRKVLVGVRIGQRDRATQRLHAREEIVVGQQAAQRLRWIGRDVTAHDLRGVQPGQQRGLPGRALRQPTDAQRRIRRDDQRAVVLKSRGEPRELPAQQRVQTRRVRGDAGIDRRVIGAEAQPVDKEQQRLTGHRRDT